MTTIDTIDRLLRELTYGTKDSLSRFYAGRKVSTLVIHDLREVLMDFKKLKARQIQETRKEKDRARGALPPKPQISHHESKALDKLITDAMQGTVIYNDTHPDQITIDGQTLKLLNRSWDQLGQVVWIDHKQDLFYASEKIGIGRLTLSAASAVRASLVPNRAPLSVTLQKWIVMWYRNRNLAKLARAERKRTKQASQNVAETPAITPRRGDTTIIDMPMLLAVRTWGKVAGRCQCRPNSSFAKYRREYQTAVFYWSWTSRGTIKIEQFDYSCTMTPGRFIREFVSVS